MCMKPMDFDMFCVQSIFDNLDAEEMRKARTKANPFETIRGMFFLNRYHLRLAKNE